MTRAWDGMAWDGMGWDGMGWDDVDAPMDGGTWRVVTRRWGGTQHPRSWHARPRDPNRSRRGRHRRSRARPRR